jgi:serine/threonine-protein kinase
MSLTHDLRALVDPDIPIQGLSPSALGRYRIESEIGQGAMGIVYRAIDPLLERPVALKVIRLPLAMPLDDRRQAEQRFLREASLAASISHPNSVTVHDFGRDEETDLPFIAFEYLEGRPLTQVIAQGPRPQWREALRIISRLADALHHAHRAGVIHRDIKPGNVMVLDSGEPKLLDFGIARVSTAALTGMGDTWGTPAYMSPEQVTGGVLDARSDLFSLGALCFELLTGRQAFSGDNVPQIVSRIAFGEAPRPSSLDPTLSRDVDLLLARALAKDPEHRYASGLDMVEDIQDILGGRPLRERAGLASPSEDSSEWAVLPAPSPDAGPPAVRRARVENWAAAVAGGLVVAAAAGFWAPRMGNAPHSRTVTAPAAAAIVPAVVPAASILASTSPAPRPTPQPARVALSVEHRFERGRLRVFVDGTLALDRRLTGRPTRHLLLLKRQSGSLGDVVEVPPGSRVLRFEVEADGVRRTGRVRGSFRPDETRLLRLKAGKRVDLEWQS